MLRVPLVFPPQFQQRSVGFLNDAADIFFQNEGEIAALAHRIPVGAFAFLNREQRNAAPNNDDDRDPEIGRALSDCLQPLRHTKQLSTLARSSFESLRYGRYLLLWGFT